MNRNFYVVDFYSLAQYIRLTIFKALTPESTSISNSQDPLFLCLLFFPMFFFFQWFLFLYNHTLVHLSLEECALKLKFVTKLNFLHQNIYAHEILLMTFAFIINLQFLQSQTLKI